MSAILNQSALPLPRWISQLLMLLLITASMLAMLHVAQPWAQMSLLAPLMATLVVLGTGTGAIFLLRHFRIQKQFFLIPLAGTYGAFVLAAITAVLSPHEPSISHVPLGKSTHNSAFAALSSLPCCITGAARNHCRN